MKHSLLTSSFLLSLLTISSVSASNTLTLPQVATQVQNVQSATNTSERGFIGNIIANIFQPAGRIKTIFLSPFQLTEDTSYNNTLPRWTKPNAITEGRFEAGTIRDNGSRIGVGVTPHSSATLRVNGVSLFDGLINANSGIGAANNLSLIATNDIILGTNGSARIIVGANGNVGMGVSPDTSHRLRVNGNIEVGGRVSALTPINNNHLATKGYVDANSSSYTGGSGIDINASDVISVDNTVVRTSRAIATGNGLTGGGNLGANRTLSFDTSWGDTRYVNHVALNGGSYNDVFGTSGNTVSTFYHSTGGAPSDSPTGGQSSGINIGNTWGRAQLVFPNGGQQAFFRTGTDISWNELYHTGNLPTDIVRSSRTITAGNGLTGGGNLTTNRTLAVDGTVVRTTGNQTIGGVKTFSSAIAGNITGNATTATRLQTARTIAGVSFNGTANIAIPFANLASRPTTLSGYGITDATPNSRTITAGNGLTGGGDLGANRTLSVDSTVLRTTGSQTKTGNLWFDGGTRYIGTTDNNQFRIRTNNTDRMTILNNGNIGIGTTSPLQRLDVSGNTRTTGSIRGLAGTPNSFLFDNFTIGASSGFSIQGDTGIPFAIRPYGAGDTYINVQGGNVGIGTSSPSQRLDVNGKIIMRNQTASWDSDNTVATKGYVDNASGGGSSCTVAGNWWTAPTTRQNMEVWESGCSGGVQYAVQCRNGTVHNLFITTGCGN